MRRVRADGIIPTMWDELSEPWRACVEEAWEAYGAGSLPIGAVVADAAGKVLSRGRNRIHEHSGEGGSLFGHKLAHAELNALVKLDYDAHAARECVLYTTTEPCPLCAGALRMADLSELRYASREPWAGSAAMFETVPYLKRGNVREGERPGRRTGRPSAGGGAGSDQGGALLAPGTRDLGSVPAALRGGAAGGGRVGAETLPLGGVAGHE